MPQRPIGRRTNPVARPDRPSRRLDRERSGPVVETSLGTFGFKPSQRADELAQYDVVKFAVQQAFIDAGGTLSHHHAVGTEHARWLEQDVSAPGRLWPGLGALTSHTDVKAPKGPGKPPGRAVTAPGSAFGPNRVQRCRWNEWKTRRYTCFPA
jgi:hypothetical protein